MRGGDNMRAVPGVADRPARILIVDDERQNRQLLEIMLEREGFVLVTAASGEEALAEVAREPPDLILLDVMMPAMDGYEVAARVKGNVATRNIPIIMVTALDDRGARIRGLSVGAEEFLSKPVDRAELSVRVRNLLRLKAYGDYHDRYSRMLEGEAGSRAAELIESEARFRQMAEAIDEVFFLINSEMTELYYVSPAYERIYGRTCESVYADPRSWGDSVHPEDRERMLAAMMVAGRLVAYDVEYRIVRQDGSIRSIRSRASPVRGATGESYRVAGIAEDITERTVLAERVRQAGKMDAIGQLAAGVAHDFNNLLSVILSYSEMLAADLKDGDPMREDLGEIRGAGMRAVELTRQLLAFSRKQVLQPRIVDLSVIVHGMERMLRRLLGEDVELTAICAPALGKIVVDPGQLEQVIMNLAVNARDAMPTGGRLTIETAEMVLDETYASQHVGVRPGPHVMLAVTDTGIGMDKGTQSRMFEPFFSTKAAGKGTGLGLATVFGIVQQSGGTIWAYSEPGIGTTFKVYFPRADQAALARSSMAPLECRPHRGSETILLVEDEESVRVLTRTILRKFGYNVLDAQNGGEAFLVCEEHTATIHLLLTDVVMPRMSGRQLAERLVALRPTMKVLYMSGYTDDAIVRNGIFESTVAFLQKPITPDALGRKVREVLDGAG